MKKLILFPIFLFTVNSVIFSQSDANEVAKDASLGNAIKELSSGSNSFVSFSTKEDTKGSRYLFLNWVKGAVTDTANRNYTDVTYYYNYDKISHNLFMTVNKKDVIEIDKERIRAFTLNNNGTNYYFERIPSLLPDAFFQVIQKDTTGYSAYKITVTKFQKANFHTDGMVETGKNYDEFEDDIQYYIGFKNNDYKKVDFTKKSLSKALGDNPKAIAFFKEHQGDEINESYLLELIIYLNQ